MGEKRRERKQRMCGARYWANVILEYAEEVEALKTQLNDAQRGTDQVFETSLRAALQECQKDLDAERKRNQELSSKVEVLESITKK